MKGIHITNKSDKHIYQQLIEQISSQILSGEFKGDFNLPPMRTAAKELMVSIITVKKAWEELERIGLIYSVIGKGCFVSKISDEQRRIKREEIIMKQLKMDLIFYKNLKISKEDFIELVGRSF